MSSRKTIWEKFQDEDYAHGYFDEYLNTYIATQIKTLREQRGYTQEELGEHSSMAQERISLLENVNYSSWTVNVLRKVARALGVRLKVSFETFGSGVEEVREFNIENLRRPSLAEELEQHFRQQTPSTDTPGVLKEIYDSASTKNRPAPSELLGHTGEGGSLSDMSENPYETSLYHQRKGNVDLPSRGFKPPWKAGEEHPA